MHKINIVSVYKILNVCINKKGCCVREIYKENTISYSAVNNIKQSLVENNLLKFDVNGNKHKIYCTKKGIELHTLLAKALMLFDFNLKKLVEK